MRIFANSWRGRRNQIVERFSRSFLGHDILNHGLLDLCEFGNMVEL